MTKHYILNINPQAEREWEKCTLRNPISGEHPDLKAAIAEAVGNQSGSYLIAVNIEVQILEKAEITASTANQIPLSPQKKTITNSRSQELLAS
jgi:hypothetical protein